MGLLHLYLMYECTIIAVTTLTFVAHKWGFACTFYAKGTEPTYKSAAQLSYMFSGTNCVRKSGTACAD